MFTIKVNYNSIFLVANFFEIKASYGLQKEIRNCLMRHLLEYTGQFAQAIQVKAFLMRPLSYGLIPDFTKFDKINVEISKVGGCLPMEYLGIKYDENADVYYLHALHEKEFYLYSPEKLYLEYEVKDEMPRPLVPAIAAVGIFAQPREVDLPPQAGIITENNLRL